LLEKNRETSVVKPLAKFIGQLPQYTLATKSLDAQTSAVRDAFQSTQSPMTLLFETLPLACGYPSYVATDLDNNNPNDFLNELVRHLNILNKAYDNLLNSFREQLAIALKESADLNLTELRAVINQKYVGLEKYTVDLQGLKAFILRLQNNKETDKAWLESVAAFLGKMPPDKWLQNNSLEAEYRLIELSGRLEQLTVVRAHQLQTHTDTQVTVFRVVNKDGETDQVAYLNPKLREQARLIVKEQQDFKQAGKQLKLAIIAQLLSEVE
jgi:hypothetical protein